MNETIAERAGHVWIHFRHHVIRRFDRGFHHVHRNAETAKAVRVRRADLHQRNVQVDFLLSEQGGHVAEEDRRVIGHAFVDRLARVRSHKKCVVSEVVQQFAPGVGSISKGQDVNDLDIVHFGAARCQGGDQLLRRRATGADEDAHSAAQMFEGLLRCRPAR